MSTMHKPCVNPCQFIVQLSPDIDHNLILVTVKSFFLDVPGPTCVQVDGEHTTPASVDRQLPQSLQRTWT